MRNEMSSVDKLIKFTGRKNKWDSEKGLDGYVEYIMHGINWCADWCGDWIEEYWLFLDPDSETDYTVDDLLTHPFFFNADERDRGFKVLTGSPSPKRLSYKNDRLFDLVSKIERAYVQRNLKRAHGKDWQV